MHRRTHLRCRHTGLGLTPWISSVRLGPLTLKNPLIAASGCFGYGLEYGEVVDLSSLGGVCVKGLFLSEREGHPPPRIVETPGGMLNAIGLQGIGVHRFVAERLPELRARGATVFVNICGVTLDEYVEVARVLSDAEGVAAIELNISCPNIKEGGIQFGCSLDGTYGVVSAVKKVTHLPVIPKLTPNVTSPSAVRPRGRGRRRRCDLAGQHVSGDGHRRRDQAPEAVQHHGGAERPGHPPDRRAHGLRVPARGEDSHHRDGRHHGCPRRARVLHRRRGRRPGRHGQLRGPVRVGKILDGIADYMTRHGIARIADMVGTLDTSPAHSHA